MPNMTRQQSAAANASDDEPMTKAFLIELLTPLAKTADIVELRNEISAVSVKADTNTDKITELENRIKALENKLLNVTNVVSTDRESAQARFEEYEQYQRRASIRVNGIPRADDETNETLVNKVIALFGDMGVELRAKDFFRLHRIGRPYVKDGITYQQVIIKFKSWDKRCAAYNGRREAPDNIYVNLDLTKPRYKLHMTAKEALKNSASYCYIDINCRPVIVTSDGEKKFFTTASELEMILQAVDPDDGDTVEAEGLTGDDTEVVDATGSASEVAPQRGGSARQPSDGRRLRARGGRGGRGPRGGRGGFRRQSRGVGNVARGGNGGGPVGVIPTHQWSGTAVPN